MTTSRPSAAVASPALPTRPARVASLRALMGTADPAVRPLARGIRAVARRHFALHVEPLVRAHWPALVGDAFYEKLQIGTCDLYASAPYTALFCALDPPPLVRLVTGAGNALPLPPRALAVLGGAAMEALGRVAYAPQHRRIVLVAAFIVVVDHVFDHCMHDPPEARERRLVRVLRGEERADGPELALAGALSAAMGQDLEAHERAAFEAAMDKVYAWIHAEVRAMRGEPDPAGLGHRLAGVEGTIDGLLFPVLHFGCEGARRWMYDVSMFVQVADDWLDYEHDLASDRSTPVLTGEWSFRDVEAAWGRSVTGIEALVRAAGHTSPRYVRFVREAFVMMMRDVMDAMAARPDA